MDGPNNSSQITKGLITKGSGCQMPKKRKAALKHKAKSHIHTINGNLEIKAPNKSYNALCY